LSDFVEETSFVDVLSSIVLKTSTIELLPFAFRSKALDIKNLGYAFLGILLLVLEFLEVILSVGKCLTSP